MKNRGIVELRSKSYKTISDYYSRLKEGKSNNFCKNPIKEKERLERILKGAEAKSQIEGELRKEAFKNPLVSFKL